MYKYASIVVSGNPGAGKAVLTAKLAEKYGWPIFSVGNLWRKAWQEKYPNKEVSFEQYWGSVSVEDNKKMDAGVKDLIEKGGVIGDFRYCSYLDRSRCLLVFLTADVKIRASRVKGQDKYVGMTEEAIADLLDKREADELRNGFESYGVDYRDPRLYHAVLNSGLLTLDEEFGIINRLMEA